MVLVSLPGGMPPSYGPELLMIITMTELVYVLILINKYIIFSDQRSCALGQGAGPPHPPPMLWEPTSPITVLANPNIASSVKCYGPRPRP